jgi:glucokinase
MPTAKRRTESTRQAVIAIDLGGTKLASAIFTSEGRPLAQRVAPLERRQGAAVGKLVVAQVRRLTRAAPRHGLTVRAVGAAVPGIVNARRGNVWAPNIPEWGDYPLHAEITAAVNDSNIKVVVDSDRSASILGEAWQGAARGCRDAVFVAVGTGIGAGILAGGRVLDGAHGIAGAIGWLALDRPFRREYVGSGCFESRASGEGLASAAARILGRNSRYSGPLRANGRLTAHDVFDAYERGDEVAEQVLREAIEFWGMASANLVSLLNPEKIIFGGGVFGPAAQFLDAIAAEARRWAQPVAIERVKFEVSQLGSAAALYGAAYRALRQVKMVK